ncbi:BTAD domain-containing putative transcriptional regulator [Aestuariivirga sp.]|uniref:BTAD domain-containing putative transcriptional regulator n=1 Tax=Aestuariivirga sp. TaxID=2650926 RepID=UPI003918DC5A
MRIQLIGAPAVVANGKRLEHPSRKAMALLAYLAMRAGEHISRSHLASLLWADSGEEQARANLRQTLSQLRKLFQAAGADPILVPFDKVVLSADVEVDARSLLADPAAIAAADVAKMPAFLEGLEVQAPEFDSWLAAQRATIRSRLVEHLLRRAEQASAGGDPGEAVEALAIAVGLDPLKETAHRKLIEALAAQGRSDEALKQYDACRTILWRDLQIEPHAATRALAARIRSDRRSASPGGTGAPARQFPPAGPALVVSSTAGGERQHRAFGNATEALVYALERQREAGTGASLKMAVLSASDGSASSDAEAEMIFDRTPRGEITVSSAVLEHFQQRSPFRFDDCRLLSDGRLAYRLVSEIDHHRLLVLPTVIEPPMASRVPEFSVAVLPLVNRAPRDDPYRLGETIAEEIIHRLSRFRGLTVAAPSAGQSFRTLSYPHDRGRALLGVNYLVDGHVVQDSERLVIHLNLIDLRVNHLVFSHRFDGVFPGAVFDQGELADQLATAIFHKTQTAEMKRAEQVPSQSGSALEWYLRGLAAHRRSGILPENAKDAFDCFSQAIAIDPRFARAMAWRLCAVSWYNPAYLIDPGMRQIQEALSIDEEDAEIHRIAGALHMYRGDSAQALRHMERAIYINPSDAYLLATSAVYWAFSGEPQRGLALIDRAMSLDPFLPAWCLEDHGVVLYTMQDYDEAVRSLTHLASPRPRALAYLAASQVGAGLGEAAKHTIRKALAIAPGLSAEQLLATEYYCYPQGKERLRTMLNAAGLK